jgi:hypothetical protein
MIVIDISIIPPIGFNIIAMTAIATLAISILAVRPILIFHPPIF